MKVNYVKTIGFRKFKKIFETELYDITNVTGKNRSGKSNVLYAIINIMLGTNLSGDEKSCLINKNCDASYGELHFTDNNGNKHILIRGKHRFDNKHNFLTLDGKSVTQIELTSFYKEKKLFLSIINPLYFLNKKPAEQKELVDKYLSDICPKNIMEQVYDKLSIEEQKILEGLPSDIPTYISELNEDVKRTKKLIDSLDGKIDYAQNIASEELQKPKQFEKEVELSLARQELAFLTTDKKIVDKENQKKIVEQLEKELLNKETEISELDKSMKLGKQKYLAIKNGDNCLCPTCGQHIENTSKAKTIENMRESLTNDFNKKTMLEAKKKDLEFNLVTERCKYHALEGNSTIDKSKQIAIIESNIRQLENEQMEIQKFNNEIAIKEKNINSAKSDILKFNNDKKSKENFIEQLNKAKQIAQKLYISYIEEKMKIAKEYLKDVNIKFYSILKTTGEIKEDFIITYKNNPLSDLSRSETIATALEFANMFNKISRVNAPIFIDDYESCADYDFIKEYSKDTQLIISKVEKGHLLKIADNNSNNYIVVKPTIKGYRTIQLNKNVAEILQAA